MALLSGRGAPRGLHGKRGCNRKGCNPFFVDRSPRSGACLNMRGDEVPDLGGRVAAFALCGEVFGDDAFGERLVYGGPHGAAFPVEPQVFEQHGGREDRGHRVGDVLPRSLRIGAVDRLEERHLP